MTVRTRFAPSPTGYLHVGGARTALFSWLYARKLGGEFILRIEDTDRERSTEESVQAILDGMDWLGLDYDEGPFYQTQRMDRYQEVIQYLLDNDLAYRCYCTREELDALREEQMKNKEKPRYDGRYRDFSGTPPEGIEPVIRFKNPLEGEVVIEDEVKGRVIVSNAELDDLIIARSDGSPTYNLTVVVDDMDMGITHVVRGDDHLNNTPRQMNILKALGAEPPVYAHVPMILGDDGKRLSKRHGAVSVMQYKEDGYLPEALLNYLVRLGWSHGDQELFSLDEMKQLFSLEGINKAPSAFNTKKLIWINEQYLKREPAGRVSEALKAYLPESLDLGAGPPLERVVEALRERSKTLLDIAKGAEYFYQDPVSYDEKAATKQLKAEALPVFEALGDNLAKVEPWEAEGLHSCVAQTAEQLGLKMGKVGMPLRLAMCGGTQSPDIGITLELIGRPGVLRRIESVINFVKNSS